MIILLNSVLLNIKNRVYQDDLKFISKAINTQVHVKFINPKTLGA